MKHYKVQSTPTHYRVEVEQKLLAQEPALLEQEGQPIAVLLPMTEYEAFRNWQATGDRDTRQHPSAPKSERTSSLIDFEKEVKAFDRMKPQLLAQYPGRVVAIYQERVAAIGDHRLDVLDQVWDQFGEVTCYIENIVPETPAQGAYAISLDS